MKSDHSQFLRNGAVVLKQNIWYCGIIRLSGPDRLSWLQGMVSNEVEKLLPGQGTYAAHLNAQGKLIGQMAILIGVDEVWLSLESSNVGKVLGSLEPMIVMEEVLSEDISSQSHSIEIVGSEAGSILEKWLGEPLNLGRTYDHRAASKCRRIFREELGYTLWLDEDKAETAIKEIQAAGATVINEADWNIIRIEAGLPIYGIDIDESTTLPELGERGISYDKGCYIGQEVVARIKYIGTCESPVHGVCLRWQQPHCAAQRGPERGQGSGHDHFQCSVTWRG
jgi:folate-binding protein YgfZ